MLNLCYVAICYLNLIHVSLASNEILGTAGEFALLGGSTITNTGLSVVSGDIGLFPGTSIVGLSSITLSGVVHNSDAVAQEAQGDAIAAYNYIAKQKSPNLISSGILDSLNLVPGVYKATTSLSLAGTSDSTLTLDAGGDSNAMWFFQVGSTLITGAGGTSSISLINGAKACNVYWQVGTSATINQSVFPNSLFVGNLIAMASITINSGVIDGTMIARSGAITITSASTISAGTNQCSSTACVPPNWSMVTEGCGTHVGMTLRECNTLKEKWLSGVCSNESPQACPIPITPVYWLGRGSTIAKGKPDGGCKVWFDCYQVMSRNLCLKMRNAPCLWKSGSCCYMK
jgi:hypothetical protein